MASQLQSLQVQTPHSLHKPMMMCQLSLLSLPQSSLLLCMRAAAVCYTVGLLLLGSVQFLHKQRSPGNNLAMHLSPAHECIALSPTCLCPAAYLIQLRYDSVILEIITTGAVFAFVFRAILGYRRLNQRYTLLLILSHHCLSPASGKTCQPHRIL